MNKKLYKEDKKFIINLTLSNRQFLITTNSILLSLSVALTSFLTAIYGLLISLQMVDKIFFGIICLILIFGIWIHWYVLHKKNLNYIKSLNEQYQKYFFELYPHLKEEKFYY